MKDKYVRHALPAIMETFIALLVTGTFVIFVRSPHAFIDSIIYAEDATWSAALMQGDSFHTYLWSRDDYLVLGNLILLRIALIANHVFFGADLAYFPQIIAVVSYAFFSLLGALSYVTLDTLMSRPARLGLWLLIILLPVGVGGNEIWGRTVQAGYTFVFLVTLFLIWRERICSRRFAFSVFAIDVGIIICIGTNPACAPVVGLYILTFIRHVFPHVHRSPDRRLKTFNVRSIRINDLILGLMALAIVSYLFYRIMYFRSASDLSSMAFDFNQTIEFSIARPLIYPFVFSFYTSLDNLFVVFIASLIIVIISLSYINTKDVGNVFLISISAFIFYTVLTVYSRPGLTAYFANFRHSGVDRYFYGHNLLVLLVFVFAIDRLATLKRLRYLAYACWIALFSVYAAGIASLFETMQPKIAIRAGPTFVEDVIDAARRVNFLYPDNVSVQSYPRTPNWEISIPKRYIEATVSPAYKYEGRIVHQPPAARGQPDGLFIVKDGYKQWIANGEWITRNGYKHDSIMQIPSSEFDRMLTRPGALQ